MKWPLGVFLTLVIVAIPLAGVQAEEGRSVGPLVVTPDRFDTSPPLRTLPITEGGLVGRLPIEFRLPEGVNGLPASWGGLVAERENPHFVQDAPVARAAPAPDMSFETLGTGLDGYSVAGSPPDTVGAPGREYFVQWVNLHYAFFDKQSGQPVDLGGASWASGNTLWSGFGGACESTNNGDPIVLYDQLADRWFMSQFSVAGPYYQCIAVSATSDPTGAWHRYAYLWPGGNGVLNDYPHFGLWSDGYYLSVNEFQWLLFPVGAGVAVFDRDAMLTGSAADMVYFGLPNQYMGLLPSDLDGTTPPPENAPNPFFAIHNGSPDALRVWRFSVDWDDPGQSTFGGPSFAPDVSIPVSAYNPAGDVPQPGVTQRLDSISDRLMYRVAYRSFGAHESVVLNHSVDEGGRAGIRWYEVRDPNGAPVLFQEGTYAPAGDHRWMGSIAMDQDGNMALGFSVASTTLSPSVRYAARRAGDPPGQMAQGEAELVAGSGAQSSIERWGDYSAMTIDPVDDCTFWYTQEYVATLGANNWRTRTGSFRFPDCGGPLLGDCDSSEQLDADDLVVLVGALYTDTSVLPELCDAVDDGLWDAADVAELVRRLSW